MYVNQTNEDLNESISRDQYNADDPYTSARKITVYIGIPLRIISLLLDLLLIYVVLRYKALKTRNNYYIVNYAICNAIYLIADFVLHLTMIIFFEGFLEANWFCTFVQFENYFLSLSLVFIAGYTMDEYAFHYFSEFFLYMYKNGYKYVIGSVYILHVIVAIIISNVCFASTKSIRFDVSFIIVTIVYIILLIFLVKVKIDIKKMTPQTDSFTRLNMSIKVSLLGFLVFLPLIVYYNILNGLENNKKEENLGVLWALACIPEYMAYCATLVITYRLFRINKFFRLAICKVFCQSRKDLDYSRLDTLCENAVVNDK